MSERDYSSTEIIPNLPYAFHPEHGHALPDDLVGSRIIRMGTVSEDIAPEGGGLVIDFCKLGEVDIQRIVFGFNGSALWVEYQGYLPTASSQASSR